VAYIFQGSSALSYSSGDAVHVGEVDEAAVTNDNSDNDHDDDEVDDSDNMHIFVEDSE
jgi:hypothetical protein